MSGNWLEALGFSTRKPMTVATEHRWMVI
ncbi:MULTISPECIES: SymE family type I addiction module toxin [Limnobaculum]